MPRKKTITTVEETDETPKEQELDYTKDLADKSFEQVAADTPEEKPEAKDTPPEEKPKEDEFETVEFDPEAFKKEVAEQTRKELLETLKGSDAKETAENVDHYQKFQQDFFKNNNRQPTWFEVAKDMEEQALLRLEARQVEKAKADEDTRLQQTENLNRQNEETNKYIDATLNELYDSEKMPRIQNEKDPNDYGLQVKKALLTRIVEVNSERIQKNMMPKTLKEIWYEDFVMPRRDVAGADAPVNMGRGGYTPDEKEELDYRDITGPRNSFRNIIAKMSGK